MTKKEHHKNEEKLLCELTALIGKYCGYMSVTEMAGCFESAKFTLYQVALKYPASQGAGDVRPTN